MAPTLRGVSTSALGLLPLAAGAVTGEFWTTLVISCVALAVGLLQNRRHLAAHVRIPSAA
jgi:hypothetical protein